MMKFLEMEKDVVDGERGKEVQRMKRMVLDPNRDQDMDSWEAACCCNKIDVCGQKNPYRLQRGTA